MPLQENCFISFKEPIDSYTLPDRFTFPFYYQPHPLCVLAAEELQHHLKTQQEWVHNFGITEGEHNPIGKMFGVLLVRNQENKIGYLAAFSGKMAGVNHLPNFVPPIYDMLDDDSFFIKGKVEINSINELVKTLSENPEINILETALATERATADDAIKKQRLFIIEGRKSRKAKRKIAERELSNEDFEELKEQLAKESVAQRYQLRDLIKYWDYKVEQIENKLLVLTDEIKSLKQRRKKLSANLQQRLFDQYHFLNNKGESKSLCDIFKITTQITPPAAAGECAAPKLLQYAYKNGYHPLAIAEFWWGESPNSAIRKHKQFYPACQGKCKPILGHMLQGMDLDENPLLTNTAMGKSIDIIYEDDEMLVIHKPTEFLSVPGKLVTDSVYERMKIRFPNATGPLIVHRLDMSTSGLMLIAKTKDTHKNLQKQFIKRTVKKRYVALLDGLVKNDEGIIDLPLRVDLDDRPRQLVCYKHGKSARTKWKVVQRKNNQTKIHFYPITGRTHQLRVHAAHATGLNTPIVGDDLYGTKSNRLHLHAASVEFEHPISKEIMSFQTEAEF